MGVVNVTPDSFSDGGRWDTPEAAVDHGRQLLRDGADILDIGGESTRPGATRPLVAFCSPPRTRRSVVLPVPEAPTMVKNSPRLMPRFMSSRIRRGWP